ncbi:hypothetical protein [Paraflavitalea sp. CAU 1676]|uniref:hypothetical protein n=1 Tax=Paraflavitalea sp. CAU 1676 TaxID=3032598 RepID=UPI0023DB2708|nr:hypothetical protein [Paraflavitalea sp. CAU 1676]MDF2188448.1 hypothetical protein [Paraflavitalea sp. CAU 1676]
MWGWGAGAVIVILSFMIWGPLGFISIFAGLLMGFLGTHLIENRLARDKGIFTKLDGAKRNDAVQELVIGGWSFSQPSA